MPPGGRATLYLPPETLDEPVLGLGYNLATFAAPLMLAAFGAALLGLGLGLAGRAARPVESPSA